MFQIRFQQIFILIAIVFLLVPCCCIFAVESPNLTNSAGFLHDAGNSAGYSDNTDMEPILGKIIKTLLSFLGVVFFILIVYGGFIWMTAGGNTDKVETAKKIIINSVIGLTVVMFAYAITWYIVSQLVESTGFIN